MDPDVGAHSAPTQPDATPTAKVATGGLAGSAATILIFIAKEYGIELDAGTGAALATLAFGIAAWYKKSRPGEIDL
jgi:hypothetical protein